MIYMENPVTPKSKVVGDSDCWSDDELKLRLALVDAVTTPVQIALPCRTRRWVQLLIRIIQQGSEVNLSTMTVYGAKIIPVLPQNH